jgi:aminoglycoside/choline kinase family phosphotransferase
VPEIYAVDGASGIIVQEDLGDRQLRAVYESASEDEYETRQEQAIGLIAKFKRQRSSHTNAILLAAIWPSMMQSSVGN